jgi:hypothetical protein
MLRKDGGRYQLVRDDGWTLGEIWRRGRRLREVSVGGRTFRPRFRLGHYGTLTGVDDASTGTPVLSVPGWHPQGQSGTVLQLADGRKFSFAMSGGLTTATDDSGRRVMTFEEVANPDGSPATIPEVSLPRERPLLNDELLVLIAVVFSLLKH